MMKWAVVIASAMMVFASCKKDEAPEEEIPTAIKTGFVIGCEGTFGFNNAELFWLSDDGDLRTNIFTAANGYGPGDVMQSYTEHNGKGYMVMNNSQKVVVTDASSSIELATITGCEYPRYLLPVSDQKAYLSNGSIDGELMIVNLASNQIIGSISVGKGPEEIVYNNQYVFVCNSGGWDYDQTVTVIDPLTDTVVETVDAVLNPVAMEVDYQGNIWVLGGGQTLFDADWNIISESIPQLVRIDGVSLTVTAILNIGAAGDHPRFIEMNAARNEVYVLNHGVLRMPIAVGTFVAPIITGEFGAMVVHPATGEFLLSSVPDYVNNDEVSLYSASGQLLETYEVGIAPRAFYYRD